MAGVVVWALGRWGAGAVFAAAAYFVYQDFRAESNRVYSDNKAAAFTLLTAFQEQTRVNTEVAAAINRLSDSVNRERISSDEVTRNTKRIQALEETTKKP